MKKIFSLIAFMVCLLSLTGFTACDAQSESGSYQSEIETNDEKDFSLNFTAQVYRVENAFVLGEEISLLDVKGKVCVFYFWETWCGSCIRDMKNFSELQQNYPQISVFAVAGATSSQKNVTDWLQMERWESYDKNSDWKNFSLTFIYQPQTFYEATGGNVIIPRTAVVNKEGELVYAEDGEQDYEELEEILAPLIK